MSTRRDLVLGRRALGTFLCAVPLSLVASAGVAMLPIFSPDTGVTVGYFSWPVIFCIAAMTLFVTERPFRLGAAWLALSALACVIGVFV